MNFIFFVSHCKHIPNAGVPLCNKIFACYPDNRGAHSGISGRWQTADVSQFIARLLAVKVFGSWLKCIMQINWRSNVIGAKFVTCLKRWLFSLIVDQAWFQICDLRGSSFFSAVYTKICSLKFIDIARYLQEKYSELGYYWPGITGTRTFADSAKPRISWFYLLAD